MMRVSQSVYFFICLYIMKTHTYKDCNSSVTLGLPKLFKFARIFIVKHIFGKLEEEFRRSYLSAMLKLIGDTGPGRCTF